MKRNVWMGMGLACALALGWTGAAGVARAQESGAKPADAAKAAGAKPADAAKGEEDSPFMPKPAPPLPAGMTGSDASDPRASLKPGMWDAGESIKGMKHLAFVEKPKAFQLPSNDPNDPMVTKMLATLGMGNRKMAPSLKPVIAGLAFANSDLAFAGKYLFQGNFWGMNIYDVSNTAAPKLVTSMVCPGGQGDVSVYGHLMFMSVEMPNGRNDCGVQGFPADPVKAASADPDKEEEHRPAPQKERFRGVRIFDISDIESPKQVAAVQTCRGSHTHTLLVDPKDKDNVYLYVSGTSFVRQSEELAGCSDESPEKDANTSLFRIDVIKVPLATPTEARIVSSPRVFLNPTTGALNGLTNGGSHGDERARKPADTDQCHDITVYPAIGLAAGACSGNGLLLDISDPVHPKRVDAVNDSNYAYWHSATFSNDGTKVVFTDEWGGGLGARCRATDPNVWGADAVFALADEKLTFDGYYKLPAAQGDTENCVAHNGSLVPVPGRDIEVQAWYQGGVSVVDFTDAKHPKEIAYYDRGPIDAKMLVLGGYWSAYWYNGAIYGSEIARGLDVFELTPTAALTQNEIDAAKTVQVAELNVQDQQRLVWPPKLVVAKAYVDELERSGALPGPAVTEVRKQIAAAEKSHLGKKQTEALKRSAGQLETQAGNVASGVDAARMKALAAVLEHPVA